jgi:hypothetical protein
MGNHTIFGVPTPDFPGNSEYGIDTIGLNLATGQTKMNDQIVTFLEGTGAVLAFLGLSPTRKNFNESGALSSPGPYQSFFQNLQSSTRIAGKTWSYQAGAFNRE